MLLRCLSEQHFTSVNLWLIDIKTVFMKMKVFLLVLFLCFSGLNFGAQATEQDDSSLIKESKFPESLETELDSVNDDKSNDEAFREKRSHVSTTSRPTTAADRRLRCYQGESASKRDVFKRVQVCGRNNVCYFIKATLTGSGQVIYAVNCLSRNEGCQRHCDKLLRSGKVTRCSIRCCFGDLCNGRGFGLTTSRPFTRFPTRQPFTNGRRLRCYQGSSASKRDVFKRVEACGRNNVCFFGKATLRSGQVIYAAGCLPRNVSCQRFCDEAVRRGNVKRCSIRCCFDNLCNGRGFGLTTSRPFITRRPTARHRVILRVVWKLLKATKSIIEALTILLKSHMNGGRARGYKREITSMMDKVDFHEQQLEDSREPEVLRVKQDVSATRMRAQAIIKKLDEFIGEDSNDDNNK